MLQNHVLIVDFLQKCVHCLTSMKSKTIKYTLSVHKLLSSAFVKSLFVLSQPPTSFLLIAHAKILKIEIEASFINF
jgi:hypothetical protein